MKNSILHLIFLFAIILYSCGSDDNPTGGNNNPPSSNTLFTFSELTLNVPTGSGVNVLMDSVVYNFTDTTINTIKIEFNVTSNIDTMANGNWACWLNERDSTTNIYSVTGYITDSLDTNFTTTVDIAGKSNVFAMFRLQSVVNNSGSSVFIRFRNIKITKLS
ncbi:MAG: hypothetical protein IAE90_07380 [Ignavibacteria bacterium]|nr:hypothetical protein [Ignavibacteria bacterium]